MSVRLSCPSKLKPFNQLIVQDMSIEYDNFLVSVNFNFIGLNYINIIGSMKTEKQVIIKFEYSKYHIMALLHFLDIRFFVHFFGVTISINLPPHLLDFLQLVVYPTRSCTG